MTGLSYVIDMAIDAFDNVYAVSMIYAKVYKWDKTTGTTTVVVGSGSSPVSVQGYQDPSIGDGGDAWCVTSVSVFLSHLTLKTSIIHCDEYSILCDFISRHL